jgi:hypothetical protein
VSVAPILALAAQDDEANTTGLFTCQSAGPYSIEIMEKIHQEIQNHRKEELYMLINGIKIVSNHENAPNAIVLNM